MLQFVLKAAVSLRGSEKILTIVNNAFGQPIDRVPSWFSVRSWLLRLGYYRLMRPKQKADDWCWIIDHTIQLGKTKCLLILGIRLSDLPKERSLKHTDMEPIDLLPVESSTGNIVWQQLEKTALKTSIPRVIVSDYGSDLKCGIDLFCHQHRECSSLYDIKHKTACLIKAEFTNDERWLEFIKQAAQTKSQLQQTALSHLKPPNQRSKSRYMNTEILLKWGIETQQIISSDCDFTDAEKQQLPKLKWLTDYQDKLEEWNEFLQVSLFTEQWVRQQGITHNGHQELKMQFQKELPQLKHTQSIALKETLLDFIKTQESCCQDGERLPGSSEVIESVFGKQKYLEQDYAKEGFTSLILAIGALVGTMTVNDVKDALIFTPVENVVKWCKDNLGQTLQSKKIEAYSDIKNGTEVASVSCCEN